MNIQPIEKSVPAWKDGAVIVHSIFPTIQGEGPFAGVPATFIRLAGCNLQCPLCDTDYTSTRIHMTPTEILAQVYKHPANLVVITGGEPFRQELGALVRALCRSNFKVQIETNGTLAPSFPLAYVTVVCSPKTGRINEKLLPHISAFKYVLHADKVDPDDGLPLTALDHTAHPRLARPPENFSRTQVYVQPVDVCNLKENERHLDATVATVLKHGYRLCLQIHKIIGVE